MRSNSTSKPTRSTASLGPSVVPLRLHRTADVELCVQADRAATGFSTCQSAPARRPSTALERLSTDLASLVVAYLAYARSRDEKLFWAWSEVDEHCRKKPYIGLAVTRLLVESAASDEELAYVAAGPLEDLVKGHGAHLEQELERALRESPRMRLAITGVCVSEPQARALLSSWLERFPSPGQL